MNIIKRNGMEVPFELSKITKAIEKANVTVPEAERLSGAEIDQISKNLDIICTGSSHTLNVEEIQDLVENQLMSSRHYSVARNYITYRYRRAMVRKSNTTDAQILSLIINSHFITNYFSTFHAE